MFTTFIIKYHCPLCDRYSFDRPSPHRCIGGYRKRKIPWRKYIVPDKFVLLEKTSKENEYQTLLNKNLPLYSQHSSPMKKYKAKSNEKSLSE